MVRNLSLIHNLILDPLVIQVMIYFLRGSENFWQDKENNILNGSNDHLNSSLNPKNHFASNVR